MCDATMPAADQAAGHLLALIKQLMKEKLFDGVALLFTSNKEAERNLQYLPKIAMDIYRDICLIDLNDKNYHDDSSLYNCAEELLKVVATYGPAEELLLELLELIEEDKSEYVFTSALKALQIVLLRQGNEKPRALEWSLNSIYHRLEDLPLPDYLTEGYDEKQQALLEENEQIQNLLMHYITVGLFYDPLITIICAQQRLDTEIFYPLGITRRNVLCCFLIEILGKPLSLLNLSHDEKTQTNTYSLQCAKSLTKGATKCIIDPLFLLSFVETRARFRRRKDEKKGVHEMSSCNIFLIDEKLPLDCLAIYYYMIFVGNVDADHIPVVYHPLYILESCLYLIYELLSQDESPLYGKALELLQKLLQNLKHHVITASSLEIEIYKNICLCVCNLIAYSPHTQLRQLGIKVLRQYILSFDDEAKYLILKNLLKSITHQGIIGYLISLYKDLVAKALTSAAELPSAYCGPDFHHIFLNHICTLPQGIETDILEMSDKIIAALNALRFFALKDQENRTGFWDFANTLNESFLTSLRKGLDISVAHFKAEQRNVELGIERPELKQLKLLEIDIKNDPKQKLDVELDRNIQIGILNQNLCTFDLIRSLLSRTCECLENNEKLYKNKLNVLKCEQNVENL